MILPVSNLNNKPNFTADNAAEKRLPYAADTLLKNDFITRTRIGFDKFANACTLYPAKGLKGDKNANFYEFLNMGTIPYLIGSGMLMAIFNSSGKYNAFAQSKAAPLGRKMALGVLFYGLLKHFTRSFVTTPVKWLTGVDTELPYAKVIYELPHTIDDTDITSIEYHKVFESKEFPRWDLLYKSEAKGEVRNEYYDKIGKKLGLGDNLKDSDQEVKPLIKEIAVKTDMAKMLSSYLWAAAGVGYAFQNPWESYFNVATLKFWETDKFMHSMKVFKDSAVKSAREFYNGTGRGLEKHAGKLLLGAAALSSVIGVINAVSVSGKPSKLNPEKIIDKNRKYVVG